MEKLFTYGYIDEENGILTVDKIKEICVSVLSDYPVEYCYLFGSYAKGKATPTSDVDLLVYTTVSGLEFYGLVEELREKLKKKVDALCRTRSFIRSSFSRISSAGEGKPAFTSPSSSPSAGVS